MNMIVFVKMLDSSSNFVSSRKQISACHSILLANSSKLEYQWKYLSTSWFTCIWTCQAKFLQLSYIRAKDMKDKTI